MTFDPLNYAVEPKPETVIKCSKEQQPEVARVMMTYMEQDPPKVLILPTGVEVNYDAPGYRNGIPFDYWECEAKAR